MTIENVFPQSQIGAYLDRIQVEATMLEAVLEGISILMEEPRGMNAAHALVSIATNRVGQIARDCDCVVWPEAMR